MRPYLSEHNVIEKCSKDSEEEIRSSQQAPDVLKASLKAFEGTTIKKTKHAGQTRGIKLTIY